MFVRSVDLGQSAEETRIQDRGMRWLTLACLCAEITANSHTALHAVVAATAGLGLVLCLVTSFARLSCGLGALASTYWCSVPFPDTANHVYFLTLLLWLMSLLDPRIEEERRLHLHTLRALIVVLIVWTGIQKLWYGMYLDGRFFAWLIGRLPNYAEAFSWLLPAEEVARLESYSYDQVGAGPYRVDSAWFVALSNSVWIGEIVAPLLLLVRRLRPVGLVMTLMVMLGIQCFARELVFGTLSTALTLCFVRRDTLRWLWPVYVAALVTLVAVRHLDLPWTVY